ncbi:MAG: glycosyl transferase, partial [Gemmatimonadota bacterium]|nr:glycosyl transferase [Gemmatimonadota bacterium]
PTPTAGSHPTEVLLADNGIGGFTADGTEYVIRLPPSPHGPARPPLPWTNVIANETTGFVVSESGAATTWSGNSRENRLTPWFNDPVSDSHGDALYLRDDDAGVFWSPTPGPAPAPEEYEVRHGFGYSRWRLTSRELDQEVVTFVPRHDPLRIVRITLTNRAERPRRLSTFFYLQWVLGGHPWITAPDIVTEIDGMTDALLATNPARTDFGHRVAFASLVSPAASGRVSVTADRTAFLGKLGSVASPLALGTEAPLDGHVGQLADPCAAFQLPLLLAPGETAEIVALLGEADSADQARTLLMRYGDPDAADEALDQIRSFWRALLGRVQVTTPAPALDLMVNGWLAYQNLSCRVWGRSAFYQSGGAFGFRDQLQDAAALIHLEPALTRAQIVLHAGHQFVEGDVLHWWHPPGDRGMRTRFADDLLWLPYIAAFYVAHTGDRSVLDEDAPFVQAALLEPGEDEMLVTPELSGRRASVYEHCCLALDRSLTRGAHDLPLMGTGDWNDGMNRVGREGRGESVWLGFFLFEILDDFIPLSESRGDVARASRYRDYRAKLGRALNDAGWDGGWYRRAYYDDGTPLGSAENGECRIDTIAQAWAVISGAAPEERAERALDAMERELVDEAAGIIRLLTPAFDRTAHDPGYIKGYLPGVRENGGQYTHGALWGVRALAEAGRGERAARLLEMLSPVRRGGSPADISVYQTEPYVIAADVYGVAPHIGRGGWTWYTGSAGWMYRVALESILGVRREGAARMLLRPCIPASWTGFRVVYAMPASKAVYDIDVRRETGGNATRATLDGRKLAIENGAVVIPLSSDDRRHSVTVLLGADAGFRYVSRLETS